MIINSKIKNSLPLLNLNNVYVVADFDRTITNGNSQTSWSILSSSNLVPESYKEERQKLYDYYRPLEISDTLPQEVKLQAVTDWFRKHIELFVKYKMSEEIFEDASTNLRVMNFRPGAKEFIEFLHQNRIPLIIISAGIGNFVESFLKHNNCYFDNVYISSNKILFKNGIAVGVGENIIHSLNKNEVSLPHQISQKLKDKKQVILLGDQVSDLNMVTPDNEKQVISIGFASNDYPIELLASNFDIVCENNNNYFDVKELLFQK